MSQKQRVPMMRVVREQPMALMEVTPAIGANRNEYWRP
jgi:hypothetical protein